MYVSSVPAINNAVSAWDEEESLPNTTNLNTIIDCFNSLQQHYSVSSDPNNHMALYVNIKS